jgi:enterochelin esterase family protein
MKNWTRNLSIFIAISIACCTADAQNSQPGSLLHGVIQHYSYKTSIGIGLPSDSEVYYVYMPPGYDATSSKKYPVLYLLHGQRQNASDWLSHGNAAIILDKLIDSGKARPMIVVMPEGYGDYKFARDLMAWTYPEKIDANANLFSQMLTTEIVPRVESAFNVSKKRKDRAIAGLSMGGTEAILTSLTNSRKFDWVGAFSPALPNNVLRNIADKTPDVTDFKLYWLAYGASDMSLIVNGTRRATEELKAHGIAVTSMVTPGKHEWLVWQLNLEQFTPLLFQN